MSAPSVLYPEADTPGESVSSIHDTMGLSGTPLGPGGSLWPHNDAIDFMAPFGTIVVAPEAGKIVRLSGSDPAKNPPHDGSGAYDPHGAYGWSEYLLGLSGTEYFITHLGELNVKSGQNVVQGQALGTLADFAQYGTPDHAHIGTTGPVSAADLAIAGKESIQRASTAGTGTASFNPLNPSHSGHGGVVATPIDTAVHATTGAVSTAAGDLWSIVTSPLKFAQMLWDFFTNADTWIRIGLAIGGAALVLLGIKTAVGAPTIIPV